MKLNIITCFFCLAAFHFPSFSENLCVKIKVEPEFFTVDLWNRATGKAEQADLRTHQKYKDIFNPKVKIELEYKKGLFGTEANKYKIITIPKDEHELLPCVSLVSGFTVKDIKNIRVTFTRTPELGSIDDYNLCRPLEGIKGPVRDKLKIELSATGCDVFYYQKD